MFITFLDIVYSMSYLCRKLVHLILKSYVTHFKTNHSSVRPNGGAFNNPHFNRTPLRHWRIGGHRLPVQCICTAINGSCSVRVKP